MAKAIYPPPVQTPRAGAAVSTNLSVQIVERVACGLRNRAHRIFHRAYSLVRDTLVRKVAISRDSSDALFQLSGHFSPGTGNPRLAAPPNGPIGGVFH